MARIIPVVSPKPGVGKTFVCLHLARALAAGEHDVCLLASGWNIERQGGWFDEHPPGDLKAVMAGRGMLKDAVGRHSSGVQVVADSDGLKHAAGPDAGSPTLFNELLAEIEACDYLVVDPPPGISRRAVAFCLTVQDAILVLTLDSRCLTEAFDLLRVLAANGFKGVAKIVFNQVRNLAVAESAFDKIKDSSLHYLGLELEMMPCIRYDKKVRDACRQRRILNRGDDSRAFGDIEKMAMSIVQEVPSDRQALPMNRFWEGFCSHIQQLMPLTAAAVRRTTESKARQLPETKPADRTSAGEQIVRSEPDALEKIALCLEQLVKEVRSIRSFLENPETGRPLRFHKPVKLDWQEFVRRQKREG